MVEQYDRLIRGTRLIHGRLSVQFLSRAKRLPPYIGIPPYWGAALNRVPPIKGVGVVEQCDCLIGGTRLIHSRLLVRFLICAKRFPSIGIPPYIRDTALLENHPYCMLKAAQDWHDGTMPSLLPEHPPLAVPMN